MICFPTLWIYNISFTYMICNNDFAINISDPMNRQRYSLEHPYNITTTSTMQLLNNQYNIHTITSASDVMVTHKINLDYGNGHAMT